MNNNSTAKIYFFQLNGCKVIASICNTDTATVTLLVWNNNIEQNMINLKGYIPFKT